MPYVDVQTIHNPSTGSVAPAAWGDGLRDNQEFFIDPPGCSVFDGTGQTLSNASAAALACGSETFDNDAMHSTVTNPSRITAQTPGRFLFLVTVEFGTSATGIRQAFFRTNGTTTLQGSRHNAVTTFGNIFQAVQMIVLAAGEYVEAMGYQSSGGNLSCIPREFAAAFLTRA